jgi:hypothetical protein
MKANVNGGSHLPTTRPTEVDTTSYTIVWHRTQIHPAAQHGCVLCPPVPCACGFAGPLCPDYSAHRLGEVGSETYARSVA